MIGYFAAQPNTTCFKIDYADAFATAVNQNTGVFRLTKLAQNILIIAKEILIYLGKMLYIPQIAKTITHFNSACKTLLLNKLFSSIVDFKQKYDTSDRISEKLVYSALDLSSDLLTASGFFGAVKLANASKFTGLVTTVIDTKNHLGKVAENDSSKVSKFKSKCDFRKYLSALSLGIVKHPLMVEENPEDIRRVAMLKVAKDIISLALAVIGIIGLVFGVRLLSSLAVVTISSLSIMLALTATVMDATTSHKVALLNADR